MDDPLPQALKVPEITRLIRRANQLRTIKPAISYWCEYRAVNIIVAKGLHNSDDECFAFTRTLLESLETTKAERADDDAIVDNTAGQAYVEQFAQETFDRAERTMQADKVTRQTADTFDAAATFFDLTHEWGDPDDETLQKIKFAKWNAARILKAIREGADPNATNPKPRAPAEDDLDPELEALKLEASAPQPVSVEDAPDEGQVSPLAEQPSEPFAPSPMTLSPPPTASSQVPPQPSPHIPTKVPDEYMPPVSPPPTLGMPPAPIPGTSPSPIPPSAPIPGIGSVPAPVPIPPPAPVGQPPAPRAIPTSTAPVATQNNGSLARSQNDINQAQKHAKWAISALNFEDVPTAVQELRNALAVLGAQ